MTRLKPKFWNLTNSWTNHLDRQTLIWNFDYQGIVIKPPPLKSKTGPSEKVQLFFSKFEIRKKIGSIYFWSNLIKILGSNYFSPKFWSRFAHLHCKTILLLHPFSQKTRFWGAIIFAKSYVLIFFREQLFFAKSQNLSSGATIVGGFSITIPW